MTRALPMTSPGRIEAVDALRGFAMLWMTAFHLCFDLNQFGHIHQDLYRDPVWTWQRSAIVSLFLLCAGLGQAIAVAQGQSWPRFWRRWVQVAGCALLVTAGSWLMYPQSFIYFGVLHGLAVMLLIARLTASWGSWLWPLGALALLFPWAVQPLLAGPLADLAQTLNSPTLNWLGLITRKPVTQDYVPLLPWLGMLWWGLAAGRMLMARGWLRSVPVGVVAGRLALLGRWSLSYYMVHQPVLIGALMALAWLGQR
ncbi:MAG: heparan-alpha-glucosaminide N-acetyltransferase [Betaproteobacteria bacterium]